MTTYTERPGLHLYGQGLPADITPDYPTMLDMFNASVARAPDSAAIKYFDGVLTMSDLDARSDSLAVGLAGSGFAAGDRLAVYVQNNPAFVIALLAAWNKPEATAESLPGGELRTGDVGFMDPDGWFYLVDRKKDMINAAGYKVWPREVEDVLYGTRRCVRPQWSVSRMSTAARR